MHDVPRPRRCLAGRVTSWLPSAGRERPEAAERLVPRNRSFVGAIVRRWGAMALPTRAHANLDSRADSQRVLFDRIQGRSRVAATLQARHRALGGPHPQCDLTLRHARGGSSGNGICHQDSDIRRTVDAGLSPAPGAGEKARRPDALVGESRAILQLPRRLDQMARSRPGTHFGEAYPRPGFAFQRPRRRKR